MESEGMELLLAQDAKGNQQSYAQGFGVRIQEQYGESQPTILWFGS